MWSKAREAILASSASSSIYIGCDSRRIPAKNKAIFSTVIIVHRDSSNGCSVFSNEVTLPDYGAIRPRLMTETQLALEAFYAVEDVIGSRKLEVHLDVNPDPKHASNVVAAEALGWVRSLGIEAKIKPHSFAATTAADHWVRK